MYNKPYLMLALFQLFMTVKVWQKMGAKETMRLLLIAESSGYLYYGFEGNKIYRAALAYRVNRITDDIDDVLPDKDEGNILWVSNYISLSKDKFDIYKQSKMIFKRNKDINYIAYRKDDGKLVKIKRGELDEQKERNKSNTASV